MPHRMRVLVLAPDFPPAHGGIQHVVRRLVESWSNVECVVVSIGAREGSDSSAPTRYRVRRVGPRRLPARQVKIAMLNLYALLTAARFRPHIVLSTHIVVSPAARAIRRTFGIPYLQYVYGSEVADRPLLARFAVRRAKGVIAISGYTANLLSQVGCAVKKLYRIPPGVDAAKGQGIARSRTPLIVTVARLSDRYKGHDVVLEALPLVRAEIPGAEWAVIGDGRLRGVYEAMARRLGVEHAVHFLGALNDAERDAWLGRSHAFVMPSRTSATGGGEGFGIVYLEAAVHGLPVVAGNLGGACDAVLHGVTGLLVDPTDHVAVAQAIIQLLGDPVAASALGRAGAERAQAFAWPVIARQVEDLLLEAAGMRLDIVPQAGREVARY